MAYDEGLAERIRCVLDEQPGVSEKRMFGGVAFLVKGHMGVGIVQDKLMVRVGPESYDRVLRERHARRMDFTGRPMKGFVYVLPEGYETDADLQRWVNLGVSYVTSLPAKPSSGRNRPSGNNRPPNKRMQLPRSAKPQRPPNDALNLTSGDGGDGRRSQVNAVFYVLRSHEWEPNYGNGLMLEEERSSFESGVSRRLQGSKGCAAPSRSNKGGA